MWISRSGDSIKNSEEDKDVVNSEKMMKEHSDTIKRNYVRSLRTSPRAVCSISRCRKRNVQHLTSSNGDESLWSRRISLLE